MGIVQDYEDLRFLDKSEPVAGVDDSQKSLTGQILDYTHKLSVTPTFSNKLSA